jgi:hypothetical protein
LHIPIFLFHISIIPNRDDALKKQLVTLAASSLITGVIMLACITISLGIKKAFPRVDNKLENKKEPSEHEE